MMHRNAPIGPAEDIDMFAFEDMIPEPSPAQAPGLAQLPGPAQAPSPASDPGLTMHWGLSQPHSAKRPAPIQLPIPPQAPGAMGASAPVPSIVGPIPQTTWEDLHRQYTERLSSMTVDEDTYRRRSDALDQLSVLFLRYGVTDPAQMRTLYERVFTSDLTL